MVNNLARLYNTLLTIETKGESTKSMAQCLVFLEKLMNEVQNNNQVEEE